MWILLGCNLTYYNMSVEKDMQNEKKEWSIPQFTVLGFDKTASGDSEGDTEDAWEFIFDDSINP